MVDQYPASPATPCGCSPSLPQRLRTDGDDLGHRADQRPVEPGLQRGPARPQFRPCCSAV